MKMENAQNLQFFFGLLFSLFIVVLSLISTIYGWNGLVETVGAGLGWAGLKNKDKEGLSDISKVDWETEGHRQTGGRKGTAEDISEDEMR